jgi:hypothetical protein
MFPKLFEWDLLFPIAYKIDRVGIKAEFQTTQIKENQKMKQLKKIALAAILTLGLTQTSAQAGHFGGFLGTTQFLFSGGNSTSHTTGGVDLTASLTPTMEWGAFYQKPFSTNVTVYGGELNFFPMVMKTLYFGAKVGNSNISNQNYLTYGPSIGFNMDVVPAFSVGVEGTYFLYNNYSNFNQLSLLASFKFWY